MTDQDCKGTATINQSADVPCADPPQATTGSHAVHVRDKHLVDALSTNQEWKQPKNYQRPVITVAAIVVLVLMCAFACAQEERSTARLQSSLSDGVKEVRQKSADIVAQRQVVKGKAIAHRTKPKVHHTKT